MPEIKRKLRTTIIDHDPNTGDIVGATKVYEKILVETVDGKEAVVGKVEGTETEAIEVANVPSLWGGTSDAHAAKLQETEGILAAEREAWVKEKKQLEEAAGDTDTRLRTAEGIAQSRLAKLQALGTGILALAKTLEQAD